MIEEIARIMEPYFLQLEARNPPKFSSLTSRFDELLETDPTCIEISCLTFILSELYREHFEKFLDAKYIAMGSNRRVADMRR